MGTLNRNQAVKVGGPKRALNKVIRAGRRESRFKGGRRAVGFPWTTGAISPLERMKIAKPIKRFLSGDIQGDIIERLAPPYVTIMSDNACKYPWPSVPDRSRYSIITTRRKSNRSNRSFIVHAHRRSEGKISSNIYRTRAKLRHALTGIQNSTDFNILSTSVALRARLIPRDSI